MTSLAIMMAPGALLGAREAMDCRSDCYDDVEVQADCSVEVAANNATVREAVQLSVERCDCQ